MDKVIPLHLVAYSEELRTLNQAQLVVQVSLAIRQQVNQVFKLKVFSRRQRVNLHSLNRLVRFNSLLQWHNPVCKSNLPSLEVLPRLILLNRTQRNNSGYLVKKLIISLQLVDFSEANKHNNRQIHQREVYLAEPSLKVQWVEDFLAALSQLVEWLNHNSQVVFLDNPSSNNKTHPVLHSPKD